jgi:hypothetical protein
MDCVPKNAKWRLYHRMRPLTSVARVCVTGFDTTRGEW